MQIRNIKVCKDSGLFLPEKDTTELTELHLLEFLTHLKDCTYCQMELSLFVENLQLPPMAKMLFGQLKNNIPKMEV